MIHRSHSLTWPVQQIRLQQSEDVKLWRCCSMLDSFQPPCQTQTNRSLIRFHTNSSLCTVRPTHMLSLTLSAVTALCFACHILYVALHTPGHSGALVCQGQQMVHPQELACPRGSIPHHTALIPTTDLRLVL